ncbi:MAG: response regulator [Deltaproteobacteria bacterium]|nr:response regulator [Deltaproteobacteria bacterium]MCL5277746.1 response regulator [Deltaproteobacteria bacterium]
MRILIVEDDSKSARLIRDILELRGHSVIEAGNGLSAMRMINDHLPDLIFMDINLPGMDGMTLTKLIKASSKTGRIPVIALTAAAMKGDRARFTQAGCDDYVSKPFHIKDILEMLNKYGGAVEQGAKVRPSIVLVADDMPQNIELIDATLSPLGYHTISANNGIQALEKIRTLHPDIALINVVMPGLNGMDVCKNIKSDEYYSTIPVIMITALDDADDKINALSAGADEFLTKPIDRSELIVRVGNLLKIKKHIDGLNSKILEKTQELQKVNSDLKEANSDIIYRLSKAVEYMDVDTGEHNVRVSRYVMIMANAMGFSKDDVETFYLASSLHDVGKIGVPLSILLKPSALTPEEFEQIKRHTIVGARILHSSGVRLLEMAGKVALTHHERVDGTGYPHGLKTDSIPVEGRITALADVFDSMTIKRPYRDALPVDQTVEYIKSNAGTQFDAHITDIFLRHLKDILDIKYMIKA